MILYRYIRFDAVYPLQYCPKKRLNPRQRSERTNRNPRRLLHDASMWSAVIVFRRRTSRHGLAPQQAILYLVGLFVDNLALNSSLVATKCNLRTNLTREGRERLSSNQSNEFGGMVPIRGSYEKTFCTVWSCCCSRFSWIPPLAVVLVKQHWGTNTGHHFYHR